MCVANLAGLSITPESPRWLSSKGRTTEAEAAAEKLWGPSGPSELSGGKKAEPRKQRNLIKLLILKDDVAADVEGGGATASAPVGMKELLANKGVFIGCMIFLLQQFSGVNSVVYFSSSVFAKASSDTSLSTIQKTQKAPG
ncbi:MAG: hypothetical protein MMC33_004256 [Icmadophila ericetorum]|nr:hypothetical protein [Icmadophila ericetorum]